MMETASSSTASRKLRAVLEKLAYETAGSIAMLGHHYGIGSVKPRPPPAGGRLVKLGEARLFPILDYTYEKAGFHGNVYIIENEPVYYDEESRMLVVSDKWGLPIHPLDLNACLLLVYDPSIALALEEKTGKLYTRILSRAKDIYEMYRDSLPSGESGLETYALAIRWPKHDIAILAIENRVEPRFGYLFYCRGDRCYERLGYVRAYDVAASAAEIAGSIRENTRIARLMWSTYSNVFEV